MQCDNDKKKYKLEPLEIKKKILNFPLSSLSFKQQVEERNSQEPKKDKEVKLYNSVFY